VTTLLGVPVSQCPSAIQHSCTDPYLYQGVHVSLIGHDIERVKELGQEVCKEVDGKVAAEGRLGAEKETAKI
jgi:ornithine cyclodeaminase/alanine dehydrogenase-like protein (mu-crystallin family)